MRREKTLTIMASVLMAFTYFLLDYTVDLIIDPLYNDKVGNSIFVIISAAMKTGYIIIFSIIVVKIAQPQCKTRTLYIFSAIFFSFYIILSLIYIW